MQFKRTSCLIASCCTLISAALLGLALNSCAQPTSTVVGKSTAITPNRTRAIAQVAPAGTVLWSDGFGSTDWKQPWYLRQTGQWGLQNTSVINNSTGRFSKVLRVRYPAGSASPTVSREYNKPLGGAQFYASLGMTPRDSLRLSYYVRFSPNFDFVKGGKLPGLFGGAGNSGGVIPNGADGFSTRFMWRRNGDGEVYAYLPTSTSSGTSLGRGNWRFQPGIWYHLEQEVQLNQPGVPNGRIRVWLDGKQVLDQQGLMFRTVSALQIEGIFFSTFFGGDDPSWATPKDVYADFANFSVMAVN